MLTSEGVLGGSHCQLQLRWKVIGTAVISTPDISFRPQVVSFCDIKNKNKNPWAGWMLKSYQNHTMVCLGWPSVDTGLVVPNGPPTTSLRIKVKGRKEGETTQD